ncbi:Uncharacterized protein TCM_026227 [Theobroma cacao]|uniref:Uncharacterized protein n=1 Tax=Theobroma cacao TaxID=3641 RepID=A0A061F211_THECC|nr:Uncharacterized protein TCM_026227 [Theobroma cacao]
MAAISYLLLLLLIHGAMFSYTAPTIEASKTGNSYHSKILQPPPSPRFNYRLSQTPKRCKLGAGLEFCEHVKQTSP